MATESLSKTHPSLFKEGTCADWDAMHESAVHDVQRNTIDKQVVREAIERVRKKHGLDMHDEVGDLDTLLKELGLGG